MSNNTDSQKMKMRDQTFMELDADKFVIERGLAEELNEHYVIMHEDKVYSLNDLLVKFAKKQINRYRKERKG